MNGSTASHAGGIGHGKVYLIGAGPGDPELLTLKAVRALGEADVVLLDALVNPAVLAHTRPGARIVPVGKRGGCKSTPQTFIEQLMVGEARQGHVVARVKGGDPFVFGRGGEERQALLKRGIPVEVIDGITAGIAAPARLGIPVTHRDYGHGVAFVTGHTKAGEAVNWKALADSGLTLVIYMGIATVTEIQSALLKAGMSGRTPCAVVQSATLPEEKGLITTLDRLALAIHQHGIISPAIMVIGAIIREADRSVLVEIAKQGATPSVERRASIQAMDSA